MWLALTKVGPEGTKTCTEHLIQATLVVCSFPPPRVIRLWSQKHPCTKEKDKIAEALQNSNLMN